MINNFTSNKNLSFIEAYHQETLGKAMAHTFPYHRYTQEEINAYNLVNIVGLCIFISEKSVLYNADRLILAKFPHVIVYPEGFYDTKSCKFYNANYLIVSYFNEIIYFIYVLLCFSGKLVALEAKPCLYSTV